MSVQVSTRIDEATKEQFDKICEAIGTSPSNAISMFIKGVINHNGIPFNATVPPGKISIIPKESTLGKAARPPFQYESMLRAKDSNEPQEQEKGSKMSREAMFGCMKGKMWMPDDFDAPLEDFKEYM